MRYYFSLLLLLLLTTAGFSQTQQGSTYTSFDGTKIYYVSTGNGYPVVLLHGFANTSVNWLKTATYTTLVKAGYRVIVPDMRGNGNSGMPEEQGYANDAQVKDIVGLMSSLNISKYDVVGYSRGSIVAAKLLTMDKRIRKAILGGMGEAFTNPNWDVPQRFYKVLSGDTTVRNKYNMKGTLDYIDQMHFNRMALAYQQKYQPVTTPAELNAIRIPIMILRGSEDVDNGSEMVLQNLIPGARLKYVPGDHNHAYNTQEFADAVLGFIKEL
jgi:pimeloyl-ACP methyl ester carboxylesterase